MVDQYVLQMEQSKLSDEVQRLIRCGRCRALLTKEDREINFWKDHRNREHFSGLACSICVYPLPVLPTVVAAVPRDVCTRTWLGPMVSDSTGDQDQDATGDCHATVNSAVVPPVVKLVNSNAAGKRFSQQ